MEHYGCRSPMGWEGEGLKPQWLERCDHVWEMDLEWGCAAGQSLRGRS